MLVLSRKVGEVLTIGDSITVRVLEVNGRVKLGIEAPRDVKILRGDAVETAPKANTAAGPAVPAKAPTHTRTGVRARMALN